MVSAFSYWLYATPNPELEEPFFKSTAPSPAAAGSFDWAVWPFEVGMAILVLSSLLLESVQMFVHGWSYWGDFW